MSDSTREEVLEKLTQVFQDVFDDEEIVLTSDTSAHDIEEWDSLNQIKIILACEKAFDIKLNARDISTLENVGAMLEYLNELSA